MIVTIISRDMLPIWFNPLFVLSDKPKIRISFSAIWWSDNEKDFCSLFITNRALLQSYAKFKNFIKEFSHTLFLFVL